MTKAKDFYSKSVPDAIRQACDDFATSQEKLDIEVLETGSMGIFGLCKKRAHIRVNLKKNLDSELLETDEVTKKAKKKPPRKKAKDFDNETKSAPVEEKKGATPKQEEKPKQEAKPKTDKPVKEAPVDDQQDVVLPSDEVLASVKADLEKILELMGFPSTVDIQVEGQSIQCNIKNENEESIVGEEGRILDSLQYLMRKIVSSRIPDRVSVDLDVGNYREKRMQELQQRAVEMADQVKETGKTMAIPALNPAERRVVHVALQDDKKVRSRSVGDGIFKKVLIFKPGSKGRKPGPRRRGRQGGGSKKQ